MDRPIVYSQEQGRSTDFLFSARAGMVGLSKLAQAMLGTGTFVEGLAVAPTAPASLSVNVAPGQIYATAPLDATTYGLLAADTAHTILKQGISLDTTSLSCPAPTTVGYSINYLIEAAFAESDVNQAVLPYFNSANPTQPLSGQNNSGSPQATERRGVVSLIAKAGVAATTGTQTTPSPDTGYIGLAVVTVAYGQTTIAAGNISAVAGAPVLPAAGFVAGGLQGGYFSTSTAGGTADAITGSFTPGIASLTNGMTLIVRAASANATTTPTFTPASGTIAAKAIIKGAGAALSIGDIAGAGHWIELQYDLSLDKWVLQNPATGVNAGLPTGSVIYVAQQSAPAGYVKANGAALSRTAYANLFNAITVQQTGTTTNASNSITGLSDTSLMGVGMPISGSGIPAGATIASIVSGTAITISANATASATVPLVVAPFGVGDGSTTFNAPELRGEFIRGWDDSRGVDTGRVFGIAQSHALQTHTHSAPQGLATGGTYQFNGSGTGSLSQITGNNSGNTASETRPRNIALLACIKY